MPDPQPVTAPQAARVYFPNLNAIRFIAALVVIVHHIEGIKEKYGLPNHYEVPFVHRVGRLGVVLFFALSGFLITYLLLAEERVTGQINIKEFYLRRILRIWPLYYLVLALAVCVYPFIPALTEVPYYHLNFHEPRLLLQIVLYLVFLPNLALSSLGGIPFARQAWSVGTEEQFYLIWPLLVRWIKHYRLPTLVGIVVVYNLIAWGLDHFAPTYHALATLKGYWYTFPISCMAIGGIFAVLTFKQSPFLHQVVFARPVQVVVLVVTVGLIAFGVELPFDQEAYALLFAVLIANLAANPQRIVNLETPVVNYLGKISYGLYMYHPMTIVLCIYLLKVTIGVSDVPLYILSVATTVALSAASYHFMEERFIRLKARFSRILSGENVRTAEAAS